MKLYQDECSIVHVEWVYFQNKEKEPAYGADVLRWWAAVANLQPHSTIGKSKLDQMLEDIYEVKIR